MLVVPVSVISRGKVVAWSVLGVLSDGEIGSALDVGITVVDIGSVEISEVVLSKAPGFSVLNDPSLVGARLLV